MNDLTNDLSFTPPDAAAATFRLTYLDLYPAPPADVLGMRSVEDVHAICSPPILGDPGCREMFTITMLAHFQELGHPVVCSEILMQCWVHRLVGRMGFEGEVLPLRFIGLAMLRLRVALACLHFRLIDHLENAKYRECGI